jgi:hypothetical protein
VSKSAQQLDREIAESYLGMSVSANALVIPRRGALPIQRVRGIAREIDTSSAGAVMLWLDLPDGNRAHVFLTDVVPDIPQATARLRGHR